jgi:hypothetical protein
MVSYGLIAELVVAGKHTSGDLTPSIGNTLPVRVRVLGPSWTSVDRVLLYSNGTLIRDVDVPKEADASLGAGVKFVEEWSLPRGSQDVFLVAVAVGPGIDRPYWKSAKPYQPTSPSPQTHVLGCSGAVWIDADGDGRKTPAREYAERLVARAAGNLSMLAGGLAEFDEAVAAQAAHLFRVQGGDLRGAGARRVIDEAAPNVQAGIRRYLDAWRESEIASVQE